MNVRTLRNPSSGCTRCAGTGTTAVWHGGGMGGYGPPVKNLRLCVCRYRGRAYCAICNCSYTRCLASLRADRLTVGTRTGRFPAGNQKPFPAGECP